MKCFEQKKRLSRIKPRKTMYETWANCPSLSERYRKSGFKILTQKEEVKQKSDLDGDILDFISKMNKKYPHLRIAHSGSILVANSFRLYSSMGEE